MPDPVYQNLENQHIADLTPIQDGSLEHTKDTVVRYTDPNLHRRITGDSEQAVKEKYSLAILGGNSYRTTNIVVHDEESTTSEIP